MRNNIIKNFFEWITIISVSILSVCFMIEHCDAATEAGAEAGTEAGTEAGAEAGTEAGTQELADKISKKSREPKSPAPKYNFDVNDEHLGRSLRKAWKKGTTPAGFCSLVTVIANDKSYSRDLAVASRGNLGGGASVLRKAHHNEAGVVTFLVAANTEIELLEDNSFWFMDFYSLKAKGKSLNEFTQSAIKAGFKVVVTDGANFSCTANINDKILETIVKQHKESLAQTQKMLEEIAEWHSEQSKSK